MDNIINPQIPNKFLTSQPATANKGISHRFGFQKNIRIHNLCNRNAYVILAPTQIIRIKSLGIGKGNIEFEKQEDPKIQEMLICVGDSSTFRLYTTEVYISVFIEVETDVWQQWRYNRFVDSKTNDYNIIKEAPEKCIDKHSFNLCM